jgi:thiol-disulfide isomerase/thioredoxin
MMYRLLALAFALCLSASAYALPLPNGSTAPDFELTDVNGQPHRLYDYLDQGITVIIKFSATWCGICWNYHNNPTLKNLYSQYGPNGTGELMILFIEGDPNTPESALYGGPGSVGNWVMGTPYPVIHAPDATVPQAYQVFGFPTLYAVCPNRKTYNVGMASQSTWQNWIGSCSLSAELNELQSPDCAGGNNGSLSLNASGGTGTLSYLWSTGETTPNLSNLQAGNYFCTITEGQGHTFEAGPFEVAEPSPLTLETIFIDPTTCPDDTNGSATISGTGGTGSPNYQWSNGQTGNTATNLAAGTYTVQATDANGCESNILEVTVASEDDVAPAISCPKDIALTACMDEVTEYELPLASDNCGGEVAIELLEGLPSGSIFPPGLTLVRYQATDDSGNSSECSFSVTANTPLEYNAASGTACPFSADGWATITVFNAAPPLSYEWSNGSTLAALSAVPAGTYQVTVTDANDCNVVAEIVIDEHPEISIEILEIIPQTSPFDLGSIQINIEGGKPPYNIVWRNTSGEVVSNVPNPVGFPAGLYQLQITDGNGCQFFSAFIEVPLQTSASDLQDGVVFKLFPNPSDDQTWIRLEQSGSEPVTACLYDSRGSMLASVLLQPNTDHLLPLSHLPAGLYWVQLVANHQTVGIQKLLRQ